MDGQESGGAASRVCDRHEQEDGREQGRYIGRPRGAGGRGFFWARITGANGWGLDLFVDL